MNLNYKNQTVRKLSLLLAIRRQIGKKTSLQESNSRKKKAEYLAQKDKFQVLSM